MNRSQSLSGAAIPLEPPLDSIPYEEVSRASEAKPPSPAEAPAPPIQAPPRSIRTARAVQGKSRERERPDQWHSARALASPADRARGSARKNVPLRAARLPPRRPGPPLSS